MNKEKKGNKNCANTKAKKDFGVGSTDGQHDAILVKDCSAIDQKSAAENQP
jgi:hypothetical protein